MARAIFAGIIATAVVSALMFMNSRAGFLPAFPLLSEIQAFNTRVGLPATEQAAWIVHAVIGVLLYGIVFALLQPILPGNGFAEGLTFGLITWLAMMTVFAPLAGHEIFLQDAPPIILAMTFGFHMLYGAVLGISFAALGDKDV